MPLNPQDPVEDQWLFLASSEIGPTQASQIMGCSVGEALNRLTQANHHRGKPLAERLAEYRREVAAKQCGLECITMLAAPEGTTKKRGIELVDVATRHPELVGFHGMTLVEDILTPTQLSNTWSDEKAINAAIDQREREIAEAAREDKSRRKAGRKAKRKLAKAA